MPELSAQTNPFILMMDPQSVLSQIEHSERLARLHSRICRPLDKPQLQPSGSTPGSSSGSVHDIDVALLDIDSAGSDFDTDFPDDAV